jgi:hypothetical protein
MERIESGTTGERRIRCLIFIAMCVIFCVWFAYDGWVGYAQENLKWAAQNLPPGAPPMDELKTNPKVTLASLVKFRDRVKIEGKVFTRDDFDALFGEPAYVDTNGDETTLYYIGPAVFLSVMLSDGQFVYQGEQRFKEKVKAEENRQHGEGSIRAQQNWSIGLGIIIIIAILQFIRIVRTKVVVDDEGLTYNSKRIPWDAMVELDASRYHSKGWVELEFTAGDETDSLRIDSYKVQKFREVVGAIVERKGFADPFESAEPGDEAASAQAETPSQGEGKEESNAPQG